MSNSSTFGASTSEAMSRLHGNVRKAFTGYYRTKDFIRRVRSCKTASDERALVARESAAIRNSFKGGSSVGKEQRYHSLAKLVYIYLLGYPSIFGQVECMKLVASVSKESNDSTEAGTRLKEKRLGYLGVTLLSDEHQETLTLVTNSLKFDLNNTENETIQALALNSLTLLASTGMARELAYEVDLLLASPSSNIRKRAVACATKLIQKDFELIEIFEHRLSALLSDKNHSVQLGALQLFQEILSSSVDDSNNLKEHFKLLPSLIKIISSLRTAPLDTEFDISGVSDPLLQISILRTIRQLVKQSPEMSDPSLVDSLNDLLAQLATTLDSSKNVGNAVLYEVVLTIMSLPHSDQSLVNLAIGTLGRFLTGNSCGDNNLRYVALNLLTKILSVSTDSIENIQKHQSTILACLHDADSTIRRKAANLSLLLIRNVSDLSQIAPGLLELCSRTSSSDVDEHDDCKQEILEKLASAIQKYARDSTVFLNLYIALLKQVDSQNAMINEIVGEFIERSSQLNPVQVVRELYFGLTILECNFIDDNTKDDSCYNCNDTIAMDFADNFSSNSLVEREKINLPSDALLQCSFWFFGEFGQILPLESLCSATELIDLLGSFAVNPIKRSSASYALTALAKLSTRLTDQLDVIKQEIENASIVYARTRQFNLLDRTRELLAILKNKNTSLRAFEMIKPAPLDSSFNSSNRGSSSAENLITENEQPLKYHHLNEHESKHSPDLQLNHLDVFIDNIHISSADTLQLQLVFKSRHHLSNITIALATSPARVFDFDYLKPLSDKELIDPTTDQISLSILLKRVCDTSQSIDLLDFSESIAAAPVDWSKECTLRIKAAYELDGESFNPSISVLPLIL